MIALTYFTLLVSFYTPWKYGKTRGFPMFSGGIERDQWQEKVFKKFDILHLIDPASVCFSAVHSWWLYHATESNYTSFSKSGDLTKII